MKRKTLLDGLLFNPGNSEESTKASIAGAFISGTLLLMIFLFIIAAMYYAYDTRVDRKKYNTAKRKINRAAIANQAAKPDPMQKMMEMQMMMSMLKPDQPQRVAIDLGDY